MSVLFAVDIETSGEFLTQNYIIAIGWYAMELESGKMLDKRWVSLKPIEGRGFSDRCQQWWNDRKDLLDTFEKAALKIEDALTIFLSALDRCDAQGHVILVSDNASFDIAWIDYYLSMYMHRRPLCYKLGSTMWRPIIDADSYAKCFLQESYEHGVYVSNQLVLDKLGESQVPPQTHRPDEDAENIAVLHRLVHLKNTQKK